MVQPLQAQVVADSGAFFVTLGRDTIAVERYIRTAAWLNAEAALRTPQTRHYKLNLTFRDDGGMSWYEVINHPVAGVPNSAPLLRTVTMYSGDSATVQEWAAARQGPPRKLEARPEMIPLQMPFYSTYETALMRARKATSDTTSMTMLSLAGPFRYAVKFGAADTVTLTSPIAGTTIARVNKRGELLEFDARATTFKVVVERAKWADIDAYLKRYASLDSAGKPFGALSPRIIANGTVGDAEVIVNYGSPSRRGRTIFGGIVPFGEVWRTGANEATTLHVTDSVEIGGIPLAAGKYSLWTIPGPKEWQLILNKQTGQWGTTYDEKQDLVRIPLKSQNVAVPLEAFTIDFTYDTPGETLMRLTWDRTRVAVPIRRK